MPVSNLGRIGFVTKGDWVAGTYKYLDVVKHNQGTWICAVPTTTQTPGAGADWQNAVSAVGTNLSLGTRTTTAVPVNSSTGTNVTLPAVTTSLAGVMTSADKTKLEGIATGATANATDAQLRARSTHTGTQPLSTISDAGTAASRDVTTSATDTTTGRLLKVRDFNIGATGNLSNFASDLNDYTIQGTFGYLNTADNRPDPIGLRLSNTVEVIRDSAGDRIFQISRQCGGSTDNGFEHHRVYNGTSWSPWWLSYSQRNILGTVSESDGVPTGAIIERGSNDDGEYTYYADGTVEFWNIITVSAGVDGFDDRLSYMWDFPLPKGTLTGDPVLFVTLPIHSGTRFSNVDRLNIGSVGCEGTFSGSRAFQYISVFLPNGATPDANASISEVRVFGKARWY